MLFPIERYLNVHMAYGPSFAGDGRSLSFLSTVTGMPQAWSVSLAQPAVIPWPDQLTFAADRVMGAELSPMAGDPRLLFAVDVGGNENAQLFLLNPRTGAETCLTAGHEAAMHIPGEWSADGRQLLFAANRRHPGQFDLYVQPMDEEPGAARLVWRHEAPGYLFGQRFAPGGQRAVLIRAARSAEHDLLEVDLAAGAARQLNPADRPARFLHAEYGRDGRFLYALTDLDADFVYVARLELASGRWEKLVAPNWDVELLALAPNGRYLAYSVNVDGRSRL
ncbi:MAG: PD40 domain-containing protein, partial [Anaerolineales bacterium]|nr:PD40 domain-containing protein [Anaerolineales bacterium]